MAHAIFALEHFALLLLLALLSYVLGRRCTRAVLYASVWEEIAFSTGLGLGILAYLVFFLGLLGLLYPPVVGGAILLLAALCGPVWRALARRVAAGARRLRPPAILVAAILLVVMALSPFWSQPLYPPTRPDSTSYHLPSAKIYLAQHQVVVTSYLRFPFVPQTNEMLFTLSLMFADDVTAQMIQFLMAFLVALALYAWGARAFSARAGLWAAGIWLANPLVWWLAGAAYVDIGVTLFVCLGVYAFFNWVTTGAQSWLVLAAAMCGLAAGSKYNALFFGAALGLAMLYIGLAERRWREPLIFAAVAAGVAAPWYLRNLVLVGNPVEPFLPGVFGYHLWNAVDVQNQLADFSSKGMGRDLKALLLLPWNLSTHPELFGNEPPLEMLPFLALPLTVLLAIRSAYLRGLLAISVAGVLVWFYTAQIRRYLLADLPPLLLALAATLDWLIARLPPLRKGLLPAATAVLGLALCLVPPWRYAIQQPDSSGPVPVTPPAREAYLTARLPTYPAYRFLNARAGTQYRLYALYDGGMAYYTAGTFIGDWFGPARYDRILSNLSTGQRLYEALTNLQAGYFLVPNTTRPAPLPTDAAFQTHFRLIYSDKHARLFQLAP